MTAHARTASLVAGSLVVLAWGGCGGSTTRGTPAPDGGASSWAGCGGPGECAARVPGCCGVCGAPTLSDVRGVNVAREAEFRADTCDDPNPLCPGCATELVPDLVAFCESGQCVAHDLREEDLSACVKDSDCVLRDAACCEACVADPHGLVALAMGRLGTYRDLVCRPGQACPACAPVPPEGWVATCGAGGHCEVTERTHVCPALQPADGGPCALEPGLRCEYGDDPRPGCRTQATCSGTWSLAVAGCPPLPGLGEGGCPATAPEIGSSCADDGLLCDAGGDSLCVCASCLGPCSQFPVWTCSAPPGTAGCPPDAPHLGAPCDTEGVFCGYGPMCHPQASAGRRCVEGAWVDEPLACPL